METRLKYGLILLILIILTLYWYITPDTTPVENITTTIPVTTTTTIPEEPEIEKLVECNYDFRDSNGDILVMDDGSIYVVNYNSIQKFQIIESKCSYQWGIIFQRDNQQIVSDGRYLWVSSRSTNVLGKFNLQGLQLSFRIYNIKQPMGLELRDNYLYVTEFEGSLKKYDKTGGKPILSIPQEGYVFDVAVDSEGNMYVITNEKFSLRGGDMISRFNPKGELLEKTYLSTGASKSIKIDKDDNLFVMDSDIKDDYGYISNMVKKYSPDKELMGSWKVDGFITSFTIFEDMLFIASVDDSKSKLTYFDLKT